MDSLDCLAPLGMMASFGNASGAVPPVNIGILAQKGSLFLTRPTLVNYTATREDLDNAARESVRGGEEGRGENFDQPDLSAARGGAGASRSRRPQDHRLDGVAAVIARCDGCAARWCCLSGAAWPARKRRAANPRPVEERGSPGAQRSCRSSSASARHFARCSKRVMSAKLAEQDYVNTQIAYRAAQAARRYGEGRTRENARKARDAARAKESAARQSVRRRAEPR